MLTIGFPGNCGAPRGVVMGGESSSSTSSLDSSSDPGSSEMGSQFELVTIRHTQLYLIDGEESVLMQSGEFSLKLLKQTHSPLAVVVANVGEVQWPVGKDAPVLKLSHRRYTFALPGLVYGMMLSDTTSATTLHNLELLLSEYSTFETVHPEIATAQLAGRDYWTAVAPEVETLSSRVARQIDSTSTIVANSIVMGGDWAALGIKHGVSFLKRKGLDSSGGGQSVSPRMMQRMQQARRMSAVAKLMSRTLLKGAISAEGHVSRTLGLPGLDVNAAAGITATKSERNVAVASVDAFGKVVEAVETAGKSLYDATQKHGSEIMQERFGPGADQVLEAGLGAVGNVINTAWTLNKMGVKMLLRMTAASTALNNRSASSRTSTSTITTNTATGEEDHSHSSPPSSGGSMLHLQRQITLSPPQQSTSSHLSSETETPRLQTTQLFPTSAEQMRIHNQHQHRQQPVPLFMPPGNFTTILPPVAGPRGNSPFQQYQRQSISPPSQSQSSFSFQPRAPTKHRD